MFRPAESFFLNFQVRILLEIGSDFIQIRQPKSKVSVFGKNARVASRQCGGLSEEKPRVFEIQKEGLGREAGFPDEYISQNSNFVSQSWSNIYQQSLT